VDDKGGLARFACCRHQPISISLAIGLSGCFRSQRDVLASARTLMTLTLCAWCVGEFGVLVVELVMFSADDVPVRKA
jgi:hypothetical protein